MMEIAEAYRFCPRCGAKRQSLSPIRPFHCHECKHSSFFGPVAAVGAVVTNAEGMVLLLERAKEPGLGKLGLPGGFVDPDESAEDATRREIREEVGLSVGPLRFLMTATNAYTYQGVVNPVLDIFFHTHVLEGQTIDHDSGEVTAWFWTQLDSTLLDRMAFPSNRQALECYLRSKGDFA